MNPEGWFKSLLSLFLQPNCPLCGRPAQEVVCRYCHRQLTSDQIGDPTQFWRGNLPLFAWGTYGGKLKQSLAALKYENHPELGEFLGAHLAEAWLESRLPDRVKQLTVVPIPLHPKKLQQRGFNQAELIARGFCRLTGYSLHCRGLERVRETEAMFGLTPSEREKNLNHAFRVGKSWQRRHLNSPVLLLDDIYTTGTTAREAARALGDGGIAVWGVGAIATSPGGVKG